MLKLKTLIMTNTLTLLWLLLGKYLYLSFDRKISVGLTLFFSVLFACTHARDTYWVGGDGNWSDSSKWSLGMLEA